MSIFKDLLRLPFIWRARRDDRIVAGRDVPKLAVVAIFREEAPFLGEWLRFHEGVGVGHFYLYDNFSTDDFREVLAPWIARGMVTLYDWPVEVGQLPAYRDCIKRHKLDARWMAFIDIDEFLFSPVADDVAELIDSRFKGVPAVGVFSPYFGSAGHEQRPPVPIVRAFTKRSPLSKISAKTVANPRWIYAIRNVHLYKYWRGETIDTSGRRFDGDRPVLDVLRLNHYWSRSLSDLQTKISRGDASTPVPRDSDWHFAAEKDMNAEDDTSILATTDRIFAELKTSAPA